MSYKFLATAALSLACTASLAGTLIIEGADGKFSAPRQSAQPQQDAPPQAAPQSQARVAVFTIQATDLRLYDAFLRWSKDTGIQLRWDAARHYEIGATDTFRGTIAQAMQTALSSPSIANSDFPLEVCFYPNTPTLARVTRRGEQINDCPDIQQPAGFVYGTK